MEIESTETTSNAPELGIMTGISFFLVLLFLNKIDGDFSRIDVYLAHKNWEFMSTDSSFNGYLKNFKGIIYVLMNFPLISLLTWAGVLFYNKQENEEENSVIVLIAVLLGFILILLGILSVKWNMEAK